MLPKDSLKPFYDKVVWLYCYRDFKSGEADLAAERAHIRFGVTGWPTLLVVDPRTLEVIEDIPHNEAAIVEALQQASLPSSKANGALEAWRLAEPRAKTLQKAGTMEQAEPLLGDPDVVVRTLAMRIVAEKSPEKISEKAVTLLALENDAFRFEVCDALAKSGNPRAAAPLNALLKEPRGSRNPNRLRCEVAEALVACGNADSVPILGPLVAKADHLNALTRASARALVAIGERTPAKRPEICRFLLDAFPTPPETGKRDSYYDMYLLPLAKTAHEGLGKLTDREVAFPAAYEGTARDDLRKAWDAVLTEVWRPKKGTGR